MVSLLTKFVYYDNLNLNLATDVGVTMDDVESVTITFGSEVKNNSMTVKLKNDPIDIFSDGGSRHRWVSSSGEAIFKAIKATPGQVIDEEIVQAYAKHEELDPTLDVESADNLLMIGVITEGAIPYNANSHMIELKCRDRSSVVLDKLTIPQAYKPTDSSSPDTVGWRAPFIVQALLRNGTEADRAGDKFDDNGNIVSNGKYLIDARLFSDGIVDSGTTTSASDRKLIQTGQNFQTTVSRGDWVRNTSTNSYAYVLAVDSDTQLSLSKDIMTSGVAYQISNGFIQDTRINGTAFPLVSFSQINKPVNESVAQLASTEETNTAAELTSTLIHKRSMRWFIDKKNRFHWYYPDDTPELFLKVGTTSAISPDTVGHKIYDVDLRTSVEGNVNFMIYKAGEDMNGLQIKGYKRAAFSGTSNVKDSLREWPRIARQMKWEDEAEGNITKDEFDKYNFPSPYGGGITPAWDRQERSVTTDNDYNANFIEEAKLRAESKAQAEFQLHANPRWKGTIQLRGEEISVGDLIDFTSPAHGIKNVPLRVAQVTHNIGSKTGWITSITVEEDEPELEVL